MQRIAFVLMSRHFCAFLGICKPVWPVCLMTFASTPLCESLLSASFLIKRVLNINILVYSQVQEAIHTACQRRALQRETRRGFDRRISAPAASPFLVRADHFHPPALSVGNASPKINGSVKGFQFWRTNGQDAHQTTQKDQKLSVASPLVDFSTNTIETVRIPLNGSLKEEKDEDMTGI